MRGYSFLIRRWLWLALLHTTGISVIGPKRSDLYGWPRPRGWLVTWRGRVLVDRHWYPEATEADFGYFGGERR